MAVKLHKSRINGASPALLIKENIEIGKRVVEVYKDSKFYKNLKIQAAVASIIRNCNGTLGSSGNFKNGCLYRQYGLQEIWHSKSGEKVVCDHAIPVSELVRMYIEDSIPIEKLILFPVVRISVDLNAQLTKLGYAKKGFKHGFPLFRYSHVDAKIVTHTGMLIDPKSWTEEDHFKLMSSTTELIPVLEALQT